MSSESSAHAPGAIPQRKMMGSGEGVMPGGNFGIGPIPGSNPARSMGSPDSSKIMDDGERVVGKPVRRGGPYMDASRAPDHGPHK